ncbi:hypothetical protein CAOG_010168 [Capsaspora owczarzaki ATCC 30864]|uniref:Uncharacterized protein n=1 Tax=Capsaspora owczarzaki (strain ATCC 30864) TaxID=595528 RepID=A0A0D2W0Z1_CAPO3|nr:hypothetical protein CAOG_010168 [Capsaspora owczarzaki ATCC 30864]
METLNLPFDSTLQMQPCPPPLPPPIALQAERACSSSTSLSLSLLPSAHHPCLFEPVRRFPRHICSVLLSRLTHFPASLTSLTLLTHFTHFTHFTLVLRMARVSAAKKCFLTLTES